MIRRQEVVDQMLLILSSFKSCMYTTAVSVERSFVVMIPSPAMITRIEKNGCNSEWNT